MVSRDLLLIISIPIILTLSMEWEGRLKCTVYGRFLCWEEWKLRISDLVLLKRVYKVVSVLPMYCFLHSVHVMR